MIDLKEWVRFDYPTDDQLKLINQKKPANSADYTSEELMVVPIAAANNLVGYGSRKWSISSLEKMSAEYKNTAPDFMQDHEHDESDDVVGTIFYSHLWNIPVTKLSRAGMNYLLKYSPVPDLDKEIIKNEGYYQVTCYAYIEASSEIASDIKYGRRKDISIGGLQLPRFLCPLCSTDSKKVSFTDEQCPHYMPYGVYWRDLMPKEDRKMLAPYYIADDFRQVIEASVVVDGDCSQAKIIDQEMFEALLG
jgi:hypothetical protein